MLTGGTSTFEANSTDFANIYDWHDDYDTWRQVMPAANGAGEASFVYSYVNASAPAGTGSCLVLSLTWHMGWLSPGNAMDYGCDARVLALEYDCHVLWGVTAECTYNVTTPNELTAVWTVVNLGPDSNPPVRGPSLGVASEPPVVVVRRVGAGAATVSP